ncbi:MAG: OstA family protein [Hyphomonadaceae bacterium]|nr:OstA family protein [Hyphomonadaceae bacterium]
MNKTRISARPIMAALGAVMTLSLPAMAQLSSQGGPIRVNADNSSVLERERRVIVVGNVDIVQGDARLRADKVTLYYSGRDGAGQTGIGGSFGDIQSMVAEGEVFYVTPDLKARGDEGTYDAAADTITLIGEVVLIRGEDVARGNELVLNVSEGRSQLRGGDGRVQILIMPESAAAAAGTDN